MSERSNSGGASRDAPCWRKDSAPWGFRRCPLSTRSLPTACLAELLAACPQLLWLSAGFRDVVPLGQRAWQAVPASLHALEVESARGMLSQEQMESIRAAKQRLPSQSWLMHGEPRS